jgi:hypothetical protein
MIGNGFDDREDRGTPVTLKIFFQVMNLPLRSGQAQIKFDTAKVLCYLSARESGC